MINLLFTGNDKIFDGLGISLISITKHCKEPLNVIVLTMDAHEQNPNYTSLEQRKIDALQTYIQKVNADSKIKLYDITDIFNKNYKNSINLNTSYSPYIFLRLLADKVEDMPDKVLYLDIDIVANGNIKELYDYDITNYEYAAVKDYYGKWFINPHYINSGVVLFNIKKVKETDLFTRCRDFCNTKKLGFPDQSALNKCAKYKLYLPAKFNSQRRYHKSDIIRHFCKSIRFYPCFMKKSNPNKNCCEPFSKGFYLFHTINVKPWNEDAMHNLLKCHEFDDIITEFKAFKKLYLENERKSQQETKNKNNINSKKLKMNKYKVSKKK